MISKRGENKREQLSIRVFKVVSGSPPFAHSSLCSAAKSGCQHRRRAVQKDTKKSQRRVCARLFLAQENKLASVINGHAFERRRNNNCQAVF